MKIVVNGVEKEIPQSFTIAELLEYFQVEMPNYVSVVLNGEFVKREEFSSVKVSEGDEIEWMYFMGGGGYAFA
ncbi:thiamine biosynthesis protein ThiS [Carboxydothermus islandicus]|uniref:Thiamine biosynthesis protein ThiS n=1 Tax=Carboxydothermus islandicus TaxID=661089 RepID=A0A1L8CYT4_9THEO|nr:sulfur carrier protein ThiS [Carboxydothermus islandicus]GAV24096.1 thiamine biosynthesis protein ThiS [Carboxydothermus islandicus]